MSTFADKSQPPEKDDNSTPVEKSSSEKTFPRDAALCARLLEYRDTNNLSNVKLGSEIGYTNAVISQYLSKDGNKYPGDTKKLERKIAEFLRDKSLTLDSSVETIACEVADQIEMAIEEIRTAKRIGVVIGEPGVGKSRGIALYCQSHERAIQFSACTWERNLSSAMECLLKAADMTQAKSGLAAIKALVEKQRGSSRPIIVDDAHKLTRSALQFFYDFRDATGSPVVFFGDQRLIHKLKDDAQRLRRTGLVYHLKVKNPRPLIEHHISRLAPDANGETGELISLCEQIAAHDGVFGSVQMELSLAARLKKLKPEMSWCEAVRRAHRKLIRSFELKG